MEFYTGVLGFSVSRKIEMAEAGFSAVFLEKDGSRIELMKYRGKNLPKRSKGIKIEVGGNSILLNDHITFSVDDIETTVTQIKERGFVFHVEPIQLEGGMKLASFEDPNGVLIELLEHPQ